MSTFLHKWLAAKTHLADGGLLQVAVNTKEFLKLQGGSNMTGTDLYVNKPHSAAAVRP